MSWNDYISSLKAPVQDSTGHSSSIIDEAAIFSVNGQDEWAHSANFKIKPDEMKVIVAAFKSPDSVYANGFHVNGEKYSVIRAEAGGDSIWAKKGKSGMIISKTVQALILAHHDDTVVTNTAVNKVEELAAYLRGVGY